MNGWILLGLIVNAALILPLLLVDVRTPTRCQRGDSSSSEESAD